ADRGGLVCGTARRRGPAAALPDPLGGVTGDVFGALCETAGTATLVVLSLR
ncbi:hypothetical protein GA0115240_11024, partial [Streptomyces sp. DvalAA-14]